MGSKTNSQQAPEHWLREITKAKVRQAKPFFIHKNELGQAGPSWAKLSQLESWQNKTETLKKLLSKC